MGRKGKAGLVRVVDNLRDALAARKELYFATHRHGSRTVTANGVAFEAFVPSEVEVYFSIDASTATRSPVFTISPRGGVDIEGVPPAAKQTVEIDPFLGISSFEITNALIATGCPEEVISPLVQHLPKLWDLYASFGLTTVEINPIRVLRDGRLAPNERRTEKFSFPMPANTPVRAVAKFYYRYAPEAPGKAESGQPFLSVASWLDAGAIR